MTGGICFMCEFFGTKIEPVNCVVAFHGNLSSSPLSMRLGGDQMEEREKGVCTLPTAIDVSSLLTLDDWRYMR